MRIIYDNKLDDTGTHNLTASSTLAGYPVENLRDINTNIKWISTGITNEWIKLSPSTSLSTSPLKTFIGFQNVVLAPASLYTTSWQDTSILGGYMTGNLSSASLSTDTVLGYELTKVYNYSSQGSLLMQLDATSSGTFYRSIGLTLRNGSMSTANHLIVGYGWSDGLGGVDDSLFGIEIDFNNKLTYDTTNYFITKKTKALRTIWIDDKTIEIQAASSVVFDSSINAGFFVTHYATAYTTSIIGNYFYASRASIVDDEFLKNWSDGSTFANTASTYSYNLPKKFLIDIDCNILFNYNTDTNKPIFQLYYDASNRYYMEYTQSADIFRVYHIKNGNSAFLSSTFFDNGTNYLNINSDLRFLISINANTSNSTEYNNLYIITSSGAVKNYNTFNTSLSFSTYLVNNIVLGGNYNKTSFASINFNYFKIYKTCISTTDVFDTEEDIDNCLKDSKILFEKNYYPSINANSFVIDGHNLNPDATVNIYGNDFDEWNYIDGGSSGITKDTLTYSSGVMLRFTDKQNKHFYKFEIIDYNNSDSQIEIGRAFVGDYLQVDPSSLIEYEASKIRTDNLSFSQNNNLYSDEGIEYWDLSYKFPVSSSTMKHEWERFLNTCGRYKSFFFVNYDETYTIIPPIYGVITNDFSFKHKTDGKFEYDLNIREVN